MALKIHIRDSQTLLFQSGGVSGQPRLFVYPQPQLQHLHPCSNRAASKTQLPSLHQPTKPPSNLYPAPTQPPSKSHSTSETIPPPPSSTKSKPAHNTTQYGETRSAGGMILIFQSITLPASQPTLSTQLPSVGVYLPISRPAGAGALAKICLLAWSKVRQLEGGTFQ